VTSLVGGLRHAVSGGGNHALSRQAGGDLHFRFRSVAGWWWASQRMQYCSNVVNSPHPELSVLNEDHPSVPHFVLNALKSYSSQIALVGELIQRIQLLETTQTST